jgi:inner membrane protein
LTPPSRLFELLESRAALLIAVVVLAVADGISALLPASVPQAVEGMIDEPAHLATAVIVLAAMGWWGGRRFAIGALVASVAIDLDHIPTYLGAHFLSQGTPRPYTHSLATVVIVGLVALALRGHWGDVLLGAGVGLLSHLFRDMSEPGQQSGVALFWPISDASVRLPYAAYATSMVALVLIGLMRRSRRR